VSASVLVLAAEVCTALGLDLAATALELEAGTRVFEDTSIADRAAEPVRAARLTLLPPGASRTRRMVALGITALGPVIEAMRAAGHDRVALFLGLPSAEEFPTPNVQRLLQSLRAAVAPTQLVLPRIHATGRAAAFLALQDAITQISTGRISSAVVGGIDCLCDSNSLVELAARDELLGRTNIEGRLTGEGAGFLWIADERVPLPRGHAPARVIAVATGRESTRSASSDPNRADGLAAVLRALRLDPRIAGARVDRLMSCQNNQAQWTTELTWAYLRNAALCPEPFEPTLLTAAMGDCGAATGAIALALASTVTDLERAGRRTLAYAASDAGELGACVVTRGDLFAVGGSRVPGSLREHVGLPEFESERADLHLEEIGGLLDLRSGILRDANLGWRAAERIEARIDAHLRAWAHGREPARVGATQALVGRDLERVFGAVFVLADGEDPHISQLLVRTLADVDPDDFSSWCDALAWRGQSSAATLESLAAGIDEASLPATLASVRVLDACCRCATARTLRRLDTLAPNTPEHDALLLNLARWGDQPDAVIARTQQLTMRGPGIEAALWLGHAQPLVALRTYVAQGHAFSHELLPYLAALGDTPDVPVLARLLEAGPTASAARALGRIGLAAHVPALLDALAIVGDETTSIAVAEALDQICGAWLREEVLVVGEPDATPETIERTSLDPHRWRDWWTEHGHRFDPRLCYRRGRPSEPLALVDELLDPNLGLDARRNALLDFRVRTGSRLALDPTWPVAQQLAILHNVRAQLHQVTP
jgi:hypothetical protein